VSANFQINWTKFIFWITNLPPAVSKKLYLLIQPYFFKTLFKHKSSYCEQLLHALITHRYSPSSFPLLSVCPLNKCTPNPNIIFGCPIFACPPNPNILCAGNFLAVAFLVRVQFPEVATQTCTPSHAEDVTRSSRDESRG
jgi:hypothetical protein